MEKIDLDNANWDEISKTRKPLHRLAIACGGTGGHFYPGLSVGRIFKQNDGEVIMLLGGKHAKEQAEIAESYGIKAVVVKSSPRPASLMEIFRFSTSLFSGVIEARKTLKKFKVDALLGMGSFASFSAALAAKLCGIPIFLHEGNARIGKANRFLSRWAKYLAISFPPVNSSACKCPIACTGMPVRPELLGDKTGKDKAIELINNRHKTKFNSKLPTLLVFGGSQGAKIFNEIVPKALIKLNDHEFQVIHLSGKGRLDEAKSAYKGANFEYLALESVDYIGKLYSACDAAICRSGASSIAEISIFNRYSFLIPYPYAAEFHQDDNAAVLEAAGAATIISNKDFSVENAVDFIGNWLNNLEKYNENAENCNYIARPEATKELLRLIEECLLYGKVVSRGL